MENITYKGEQTELVHRRPVIGLGGWISQKHACILRCLLFAMLDGLDLIPK
jgi:hypothetical protein